MGWLERQARLEERVHDCIDEIADEFDLDMPCYPEVFYIGKGSPKYKERERSLRYKITEENYDLWRSKKTSCYEFESGCLLFYNFSEEDRAEESSHFCHVVLSSSFCIGENQIYKRALCEAIGFFGSRVVLPNRIVTSDIDVDLLSFPKKLIKETIEFSPEDFIYFQGYGLGARLWNAYQGGEFSKKEAQKLYSTRLWSEKKAKELFFEMRKRFWPIPSAKGWIFEDLADKDEIIEFRMEW